MKRSVLEYLENSAEIYPDKIAVIDADTSYSYRELLEVSKSIGSALVGKAEIGKPVAVLADKGALTLGTFFGIVQAGGFYVLLNPELPKSRLEQIQSVLETKYWITSENYRELAEEFMPKDRILLMSELKETKIDEESLADIRGRMVDTNPLYANFTSGSTGVPKGVLVGHRSVLEFIDQFTEIFSIGEEDIIGNQAPFDFDVSVKDIYSAMKTGATLVIVPKQLFSAPAALLDYICDHKVTTMIWAVSAICLISSFHGLDYKVPETVKKVLFSGEEMPMKHLKSWMEHLPNTEFVNLYGPTEITCNCTYHVIDRNRDYGEGVPIGKAFPNEDVFLLDDKDAKITEPEQIGELCVRGTALALGYYRNPEQTAKAFVQNPLNPNYPELIYRTGDLASFNEEGELMFCGRKDFQIKYMGHRIEIEEIERAIAKTEGVERCCVVFDNVKHRLYGFYTGSIDKKELHSKLTEKLPIYMIPGALYAIDAFPLTKNGKADRKKLLEMRKQIGK